jgi:small subunit ribosomal protein S7
MTEENTQETKKPEPAVEPQPTDAPVKEKVPEQPKEAEAPAKEQPKPEATEPKPVKEEAPKEISKALVPKRIVGIPPDKLKLFDRYDMSDIVVSDAGLARYINLDPVIVPHTGARHANRPFAKSKMNIVERLVNNMMRNENYTGKKTKTYRAVMQAFEIIESKTKKNPVQVFIDALENTTPREEVTRLKYGGVSVPKAVDISSSRRLDIALRNICKGAINASYKNTKPIEICLANEIIQAAKGDMNSFAVSKKEETERVAGSAR